MDDEKKQVITDHDQLLKKNKEADSPEPASFSQLFNQLKKITQILILLSNTLLVLWRIFPGRGEDLKTNILFSKIEHNDYRRAYFFIH